MGSNDSRLYGPDFFLDYGVVLVTVNYRLGPLGFFSLDCDAAPGNQGCHDQVLALQWVQRHVGVFGGDHSNVTIMGESAGGMACFLHLVSPLSRGLFHKVGSYLSLVSLDNAYSNVNTHQLRRYHEEVIAHFTVTF